MPVIVVGADTPAGRAIVNRLANRGGEVRAFISSPDEAPSLRSRGIKVAIGDLSDHSHVEAAGVGAFCAVLVVAAAGDGRPLAFAAPEAAATAWLQAMSAAGIRRVIVVGDSPPPDAPGIAELATVPVSGRAMDDIAAAVAALEEAERL